MDKEAILKKVWPQWEIVRELGEGSFGSVYEVQRKDIGGTFKAALKFMSIPKTQKEVTDAMTEGMDETTATTYFRSIMEDLVKEFATMEVLKGNTNIVSYEDHVVVEHDNEIGWDILIRMELLTPFKDYLQAHPMGEEDVIRLGKDICSALIICEKRNIVHRDIKMENVFVSEYGDFKLGDFGVARTVEKTTSGMSIKGTISYMAPEVYKGLKYNATVDLYSLGIMLYRLANNNRAPFLPPAPAPISYNDKENAELRRLSGEEFPEATQASPGLMAIIRKATAFNADDRYSSAQKLKDDLNLLSMGKEPVALKEWNEKKANTYNELEDEETVMSSAVIGNRPSAPASSAVAGVAATGVVLEKNQVPPQQTAPVPPQQMNSQAAPQMSMMQGMPQVPQQMAAQPQQMAAQPQQAAQIPPQQRVAPASQPQAPQVQPQPQQMAAQPQQRAAQVPPQMAPQQPNPQMQAVQGYPQGQQYVQPQTTVQSVTTVAAPKKKSKLGLILGLAIGIPTLLVVIIIIVIVVINAVNSGSNHPVVVNSGNDKPSSNNSNSSGSNSNSNSGSNNTGSDPYTGNVSTDPSTGSDPYSGNVSTDPGDTGSKPDSGDVYYTDPIYKSYNASIYFTTNLFEIKDAFDVYDIEFDSSGNYVTNYLDVNDAIISGDGDYEISASGLNLLGTEFYYLMVKTDIPVADATESGLRCKLRSFKINNVEVDYTDWWFNTEEDYVYIVLEDWADSLNGDDSNYSYYGVNYPNISATNTPITDISFVINFENVPTY